MSATMSRIRAKHTKPELAVRKALRERFWHGCPHFQPRRPKTHKTFWNAKLDRNMERDAEKAKALKKAGWKVITLWECRVKKDVGKEVGRVVRRLGAGE